jgi:hypothetical protein
MQENTGVQTELVQLSELYLLRLLEPLPRLGILWDLILQITPHLHPLRPLLPGQPP